MILAKDVRRAYATNIDFFFSNGELSIVLNDEEGVLRMFTYDPSGTFFFRVDATISTLDPRRRSRLERGATSHVQQRIPLPQGVSSVPHNRTTNEGGQRDPASKAHLWYDLLYTLTFHPQPYSFLLPGFTDGTLSALTPVDEGAFKRLHFLQGQLLRNVQHVAGLNPRVYR